jgi:hypothetical protein
MCEPRGDAWRSGTSIIVMTIVQGCERFSFCTKCAAFIPHFLLLVCSQSTYLSACPLALPASADISNSRLLFLPTWRSGVKGRLAAVPVGAGAADPAPPGVGPGDALSKRVGDFRFDHADEDVPALLLKLGRPPWLKLGSPPPAISTSSS